MLVNPSGRSVARRQYRAAVNAFGAAVHAGAVRKQQRNEERIAKKARKAQKKTVGKSVRVSARGGNSKVISKKKKDSGKDNSVKARLSRLEKETKGLMTYKYSTRIGSIRASCVLGRAGWQEYLSFSTTLLRDQIQSLPIGTGVAINGQSVAENTQITIKDVWCEAVLCNITDTPIHAKIYALCPKTDTNKTPLQAIQNVIQDAGLGWISQSSVDLAAFPCSMPDFLASYTVLDTASAYMRAGDLLKLTCSIEDFKWSDDFYDNNALAFQKKKNLVFLTRIEGDICYDSADSTRGSTFPSDAMLKTKAKFTIAYPGNVSGRIYSFNDNLQTGSFTGTPTSVGPNVINIA